jgi:hypothetical protein
MNCSRSCAGSIEVSRSISATMTRKPPGWFLHLPSGEVRRIRRFETDDPVLRVWGITASKDVVDVVLVSPESAVISIETLDDEAERFEVVFSTNGDEPW